MYIHQSAMKRFILIVIFYLSICCTVRSGELIVSWSPNTESDLSGYKIYYGTSSRNYTNVIDVGNKTTYTVSALSDGIEYFFAVTAYDTAYNESDFSVEVSAVTKGNDIAPPTIASVNLISATKLDLTFSEAVEKSSAENITNYQINNGINIISITLDTNQCVVHITTTLHQSGTYTITVNNVRDLAPNPNTIEPNSGYTYQFTPDDTTPPVLMAVQILDATHVEITFSEEIEKSSAENVQNFKIDNGIVVLQARLDQNNRAINLVTSAHQSGVTYTLTVNNIRDLAPNPNYIGLNSSMQYTYIEVDHTPPVIYAVNIRNQNLIDVIFSEKVEQASAENLQNYKINNGINVSVAILDINQKIVHLSTTAHQAGMAYTVTVNNIYDLAQPPNKIESNSRYDYIYQPDDHIPPTIIGAEAINETQVNIMFSEPLDRESAEEENNYSINKGVSVIQALLDTDKKVVQLITTAHQTGETYVVTINNIKDLAPTPNIIASDSKIQYTYIYLDREPPRIEEIQIVYAIYIKVFFSELVERESAENVINYSVSGGVKVLSAILDNNLKIVHLTTTEHQPNTNYTLTINNIRDRSPNRNLIELNSTFEYYFEVHSNSLVIGLTHDKYELTYLNIGDKYYIDRNYRVTSIPEEMNGYLWIKTANDDRDKTDSNFLGFQLIKQAKIYIAYDSRALNYPDWLIDNFYRIGKHIGVSEYTQKLDLWEQECNPGIITLGGNLAAGAQGVESMYVVLIETKNSQRPDSPEDMGDPFSLGPANMFLLYQNYPNPFNAGTEIRFQIPKNVYVELAIYNLLGQTVRTLAHGYKQAGHYIFRWDGRNEAGSIIPSGVYFSRLIIKQEDEADANDKKRIIYDVVRKMIMIK